MRVRIGIIIMQYPDEPLAVRPDGGVKYSPAKFYLQQQDILKMLTHYEG